jgi:hypothetical protein
MANKIFKITLNSDCIVKSISATEGVPESLSYIPGSVILGIVANGYSQFKYPFDVFHSGKVKFGNAFISIEDKPSLKAPLSWHYPKDADKSEKIIGSHLVKSYDELETLLGNKQPKQIRDEFIDVEFKNIYTPGFNFQLKSAYDGKLGRSKDSSMFAYKTIKKGTEYIFEVQFDSDMEESDIALIEKILNGNCSIGKSKTAQFGSINISPFEVKIHDRLFNSVSDAVFALPAEETGDTADLLFLYAKSDIILSNEAGFNIANIDSPRLFGIKSGKILPEKTYLDYRKFNVYNFIAGRRLPVRTAINAGSVICIEGVEKTEKEDLISKKILFKGNYLSEGFGEIYVNPQFLCKKEYSCLNKAYFTDRAAMQMEADTKDREISHEIEYSGKLILKYIGSVMDKEIIKDKSLELAEKIHKENKGKFKNITKSQWGAVRTIAKQYGKDNKILIDEIVEYTGHGVAHDKWEDRGAGGVLISGLKQHIDDPLCDLAMTVEYLAKLFSLNIH